MFSLKRQEEREGEGAGRTEKALFQQASGSKENYNRVPAFEELIAQYNAHGLPKYPWNLFSS